MFVAGNARGRFGLPALDRGEPSQSESAPAHRLPKAAAPSPAIAAIALELPASLLGLGQLIKDLQPRIEPAGRRGGRAAPPAPPWRRGMGR